MENELKKMLLYRLPNFKSEKYLKWVRLNYPDKDPRHILINKKFCDYLIAPIEHEDHQIIHQQGISKSKYDFEDLLIIALETIFKYIKEQDEN
jgi:hypothetical protein